ncbi:hypothetical protein GCM10023086_38750 [Streptomyces venetus]|uniref:Uncharacterized protein n=1 Tax=Streptomyces venetus TaxID=1701086 RepID=A0ABP8G346_9ACTN
MADDRSPRPGDLDHRLGPVVGVRAQPGTLAAGQYHGLHGAGRGARIAHETELYVASRPGIQQLWACGRLRVRAQLCAAATPVAKAVSQTGRA